MRNCRSPACSSTQSRIASAARTARSGSSSCATGAPKSAITASPMNFSTVPPKRFELSTQAGVVRREKGANILGIELLGARGEAHQVGEQHRDHLPLLARRAAVSTMGAAHSEQNLAPAWFSCPQADTYSWPGSCTDAPPRGDLVGGACRCSLAPVAEDSRLQAPAFACHGVPSARTARRWGSAALTSRASRHCGV